MSAIFKLLQERADIASIRRSRRFAADWYVARYLRGGKNVDPIRHYVTQGAALGHLPHPLFDPRWYRTRYPDVAAKRREPFAHYVTRGTKEERQPNAWFEPKWYRAHGGSPDFCPLLPGVRAEHPCLGRRFRVEGDEAPLTALTRFLHQGLGGPTVGVVEIRTSEFVSGWIATDDPSIYLDVRTGERRGAMTVFNPRPEISAMIGRDARGFLYSFSRRIEPGTRVDVAFSDASAVVGSPYLHRQAQPPSEREGADILVHLDRPAGAVTRRLVEMSGWIRLHEGDAEIEIRIDGRRQDVLFTLRTDVIEVHDHPFCIGFELQVDVADAAAKGRNALEMEVLVAGRSVDRRDLPIALEPVAEDLPTLKLFMHIPKTAGISLVMALNELPDPRVLWLYDRGRLSIADQLAPLSPGAFEDLRLVGGHFVHGIDRFIGRPAEYVAILRDPLAFQRSFFFYRKYVQRHPPFQSVDIFEATERRMDPYLDNCFTRCFAAVPSDKAVDEADLARALTIMERDFAFVGLVERMDETVGRLSALLGVDLPVLAENRTPPIAEAAALDLRAYAECARPYIRFDDILVKRAKALWWT